MIKPACMSFHHKKRHPSKFFKDVAFAFFEIVVIHINMARDICTFSILATPFITYEFIE